MGPSAAARRGGHGPGGEGGCLREAAGAARQAAGGRDPRQEQPSRQLAGRDAARRLPRLGRRARCRGGRVVLLTTSRVATGPLGEVPLVTPFNSDSRILQRTATRYRVT